MSNPAARGTLLQYLAGAVNLHSMRDS